MASAITMLCAVTLPASDTSASIRGGIVIECTVMVAVKGIYVRTSPATAVITLMVPAIGNAALKLPDILLCAITIVVEIAAVQKSVAVVTDCNGTLEAIDAAALKLPATAVTAVTTVETAAVQKSVAVVADWTAMAAVAMDTVALKLPDTLLCETIVTVIAAVQRSVAVAVVVAPIVPSSGTSPTTHNVATTVLWDVITVLTRIGVAKLAVALATLATLARHATSAARAPLILLCVTTVVETTTV